MIYNRQLGKAIAEGYFSLPLFDPLLLNAAEVGKWGYKLALLVREHSPEFDIKPEFVGFLGYVRDIGYVVKDISEKRLVKHKHEIHSMKYLIEQEEVPRNVARYVMHGVLPELFAEKERYLEMYLPLGIEGIILSYLDLCCERGKIIPIEKRIKEMTRQVREEQTHFNQQELEYLSALASALPRLQHYERLLLALTKTERVENWI